MTRVSGPKLQSLFFKIVRSGPLTDNEIKPRFAYLADLVDADGAVIDRAIALYFAAPNSFTGEDVLEFHTHGSTAVTQKLFDTLRAAGARMAEPGEFTRRAFDNGKMDLVEVDGLAALIDSRTDAQRRAALRTAAGTDSAVYMAWRAQMVEISAFAAAMLDYPADELPANIGETLMARTCALHDEIADALNRAGAARAVRAGFNIALVGDVNVGKSSLFNRLLGESRAIVSEIPGTTRDVVSAEIDIDGYLVRLLDTAGLRETNDAVETLGIERTRDTIENADLVLRVFPSQGGVPPSGVPAQSKIARGVSGGGEGLQESKDNEIIIYNKCDLVKTLPGGLRRHPSEGGEFVSALTGAGIPELLNTIKRRVHDRLDGAESDVVVNARAKALLQEARDELVRAYSCAPDDTRHKNVPLQNIDLFAEHVRRAADAIGRLLGVIGADEVADALFGQLCLGK